MCARGKIKVMFSTKFYGASCLAICIIHFIRRCCLTKRTWHGERSNSICRRRRRCRTDAKKEHIFAEPFELSHKENNECENMRMPLIVCSLCVYMVCILTMQKKTTSLPPPSRHVNLHRSGWNCDETRINIFYFDPLHKWQNMIRPCQNISTNIWSTW